MELSLATASVSEHINPDGTGSLEVKAIWTVSPTTARRKANGYLGNHLGNLLGREPTLVVGERVVWRVPVELAYLGAPPVRFVGTIDIDANTAEPLVTEEQLNALKETALYLATSALARPE
jgi:hypothetical protein